MPGKNSRSSLTSTTSSVRRENPPNGPMRDRVTVAILKIDVEDLKGTISPIEAKNLIYLETLNLYRSLLHGLDISFKGHPVITFCLREQINVEAKDFVLERDSSNGRAILEGKICWLRLQNRETSFPMTRWVKLENCQRAFREEKV